MDTICLHCGHKGFENAFVYCVKCLDCAVHRYCLDVIPETFDEFVPWFCEDCEVEPLNKSIVVAKTQECVYEDGPCEPNDTHAKLDLVKCDGSANEHSPTQLKRTNKKRAITSAEDERKRCKESSSHQLEEEMGDDDLMRRASSSDVVFIKDFLKKKKRRQKNRNRNRKRKRKRERERNISLSNGSLENSEKKLVVAAFTPESQMHITCSTKPHRENKEPEFKNLVFGQSNDHIRNGESADREEIASALHQMIDFSKDFPEDIDIQSAEPVIMPIWSGNFDISNKKHDVEGLVAHMSSKACQKVYEAACQFGSVLCLEMLPKSDVWPKSFETREPTGENIALYFFSSHISERDFGHLVDEMMQKELALKAVLQNAELLIFTSTELPLLYWRFQDKYYLWGVFRGKQSPPSNAISQVESGDNPVIHAGLSGSIIPTALKSCGARSPLSPLSNSGSYGSGIS